MTRILILFCAVGFIVVYAFGEREQMASAAEATSATIRVELLPAEKPFRFYPLLPVFLRLKVRNHSDAGVVIPPLYGERTPSGAFSFPRCVILAAEGTTGSYQRRYPVGRFDYYDSGSDLVRAFSTRVGPHSVATIDMVLGYEPAVVENTTSGSRTSRKPTESPERAMFWKPAIYRLKLTMDVIVDDTRPRRSFPMESNELTIVVLKPQGDDQEAYDLLMHSRVPWVFCHPVVLGEAYNTDVHREIFKRFAKSTYYPYAKFIVAREICQLGLHRLTSRDYLPADAATGLELFNELSIDPDFPLADLALGLLDKHAREFYFGWSLKLAEKADPTSRSAVTERILADPERWGTPQIKRAHELLISAVRRHKMLLPPAEVEKLGNDPMAALSAARVVLIKKYWVFLEL